MDERSEPMPRRDFLRDGLRGAGLLGLGGLGGVLVHGAKGRETVWQIDPDKCTQCGNCATYCVLEPSAVKCVHAIDICGYCDFCFGYYEQKRTADTEAAENVLCPVDAIIRRFIEYPYFEYTIDEELCIGCGKCVEGCRAFGNSSLYLQVRHDRCVNCNECSIGVACPGQAFVRLPAETPYFHPLGHLLPPKEVEPQQ
ncbi:MAG: 4Fe-4S binding protein [Candidatus Brocadiia bacterium]